MLEKLYRKVNSLSVDILGVEAWVIPFLLLCKAWNLPPDPKWMKRR